MRGLAGKNVLVTGGASGIGQAAAARFLEEGFAVCVLDRSADARVRVAEQLPDLSAVIDADVSDMERVRAAYGGQGLRRDYQYRFHGRGHRLSALR